MTNLSTFFVSTCYKRFPGKLLPSLLLSLALLLLCAPAAPSAAQEVTGRLETIQGVRVLTLWGNNYQKGYAHGYLLAENIADILENYMIGQLFNLETYPLETLLFAYYVRVPIRYWLELQGLYDGIKAKIKSQGLYSHKLQREFQPIDLLRFNMAETLPLNYMCSSLSGWGSGTENGDLLFARDLDFGSSGDLAEQNNLIIVYDNRQFLLSRKNLITFSFPGFIGCLTGINEDGVGAASHYGNSNAPVEDYFTILPKTYTPMSMLVRQVLETRRFGLSDDPITYLSLQLATRLIAGSYNIHIFKPYENNGSETPAAIIEGNKFQTGVRTWRENQRDDPKLLKDHYLAATNHHRKIQEPESCSRYTTIVNELNSVDVLDMDTALEIERAAAQRDGDMQTIQMMGINANTREIWVAFSDGENSSWDVEPAYFIWDDFFE